MIIIDITQTNLIHFNNKKETDVINRKLALSMFMKNGKQKKESRINEAQKIIIILHAKTNRTSSP
jgi:hypothetical protein